MKEYSALENNAAVASKIAELLDIDSQDAGVRDIVGEVLKAQGKMLRPRFLIAASDVAGNVDAEKTSLLGSIVEIIHMASLVHDDIVDDSPMRRGRESVQSRFGKDMAVYTGDFLLAKSTYALFSLGLCAEGAFVSRTIEDMCRGELLQYRMRFCNEASVEKYIDSISGKTASLFALSGRLGCMAGGGESKLVADVSRLGECVGIMFQIRDDLLDFRAPFGGWDECGKPTMVDFQNGILTLPVICAMRKDCHKEKLYALLKTARERDLTADEFSLLFSSVSESGGIAAALEILKNYSDEALKIIAGLPDCEGKEFFSFLVKKLIDER